VPVDRDRTGIRGAPRRQPPTTGGGPSRSAGRSGGRRARPGCQCSPAAPPRGPGSAL